MAAISFVDGLEKQLKCPSCKEIFTNPKTLSCLHTLCLRCINITKDQTGGLNNNQVQGFICPECNFATTLPEGSPVKLQTSSYVDALVYLFNAIKGKGRQQNCACCQKPSLSLVGFCSQCSGMVCTECVNAHHTKKHRNHQITMLQEFKEENLDGLIKTRTLCQEKFHGKNGVKKIEYFCQEESCQRCICRRCCLLEHRKHKLLSMEEMAQKLEKDTGQDMVKLEQLSGKLKEELEESKKQMTRVDNEIKVAKQKVHNAVEALVKKAREHEETMIKALDKRLQDYHSVNSKEQNDIKEKKKQLENFTVRCKSMIDKNKWELVRIQKDLKNFCQTFVESPPVNSKPDVMRNVTVHYVTDYVICQSVKNMGKIVESVTDKSHCPIESLKEARYSFVNDMDYVTRSSKGDMSMATRWKRTFLWSKSKASPGNDKPPKVVRAHSVA